jgi:hypothetical protein
MVSQTEQKSTNPWPNDQLIHGLVDSCGFFRFICKPDERVQLSPNLKANSATLHFLNIVSVQKAAN